MKNWPCGSGSGGSEPGRRADACRPAAAHGPQPVCMPYSGDLSGWSGRQARQGVQPASRAAARVILSRSLSPMKRMRMQLALWYLGTPGTESTGVCCHIMQYSIGLNHGDCRPRIKELIPPAEIFLCCSDFLRTSTFTTSNRVKKRLDVEIDGLMERLDNNVRGSQLWIQEQ